MQRLNRLIWVWRLFDFDDLVIELVKGRALYLGQTSSISLEERNAWLRGLGLRRKALVAHPRLVVCDALWCPVRQRWMEEIPDARLWELEEIADA
jgi:hypothetical protein